MPDELDIVRDVSLRLERGNLAYMLTGSMAMNYYAQPRMTRDIDIVVALTPQDTDTVVGLFTPDYYVSATRSAVPSPTNRSSTSSTRRASSKWTASSAKTPRIAVPSSSAASASSLKISPPGLRARKTSSSQALVGERLPLRAATARREEPRRHRLRHRLHRTLDGRTGAA